MGLLQAVSRFLIINNALDLHLGQTDPGLVPAASEACANISSDVPVTVSNLLLFCDTLYLHVSQNDPDLVPAASEAHANISSDVPVTVSNLLLFCDTLYLRLGQPGPGLVTSASGADTAVSGTRLEATVARKKRQPSAAGIAKHAASIKVSRNTEYLPIDEVMNAAFANNAGKKPYVSQPPSST